MLSNNKTGSSNPSALRHHIASIATLSNAQLENLERNYHKRGITEGGLYSLREVLNEKTRRVTGGLEGLEVVNLILDLCRTSSDGFATYADLWHALFPNQPWRGQSTVRDIMKILGEVISYCVANDLPILTALIVRSDTRQQSANAIENIYQCARDMGCTVGPCPETFVTEQILNAFELIDTKTTVH